MGLEAECAVRFGSERSQGKARLEDKDLYFKGTFGLKIPLSDIQSVGVTKGELEVQFAGAQAYFELGAARAEKWRLKIRYPKKLLDKLGVKPDYRISLAGITDRSFISQLEDRAGRVWKKAVPESDMIFLLAEDVSRLERLALLRGSIKPNGAIWVLWPKGQQHIKEDHIRGAALSNKLVDVKVVSFSERLSGLKLMIPRNQR